MTDGSEAEIQQTGQLNRHHGTWDVEDGDAAGLRAVCCWRSEGGVVYTEDLNQLAQCPYCGDRLHGDVLNTLGSVLPTAGSTALMLALIVSQYAAAVHFGAAGVSPTITAAEFASYVAGALLLARILDWIGEHPIGVSTS